MKNATKKVLLVFEGTVPDVGGINGVLSQKRENNRLEMVVYPWDEMTKKEVLSLNATHMEINALTLEEIFIGFIS